MGSPSSARLERQGKFSGRISIYTCQHCLFDCGPGKKVLVYMTSFIHDLTGVKDGGVDPALGVADGHPAAGIGEQDFGAAGPGSRRHTVSVVTAPVPHQHAIIVPGIELNTAK